MTCCTAYKASNPKEASKEDDEEYPPNNSNRALVLSAAPSMHSTAVWALLSIALVIGSIRSRNDYQARVVVGVSPVVVIVVVPVVDVSLRLVGIGVVAISVASSVSTVAIPRRAIDNYCCVVSV